MTTTAREQLNLQNWIASDRLFSTSILLFHTHTHARIGKYKKRNETTIQAKVEETTTHLQSRLQTSIQRKANVKYHESNHFLLIVHWLCGRSLSFLDTNDCLNFQDWLLEERKIVVIMLSLFWTKRKLMGKISLLVFLALNRAMWFFTIVLLIEELLESRDPFLGL